MQNGDETGVHLLGSGKPDPGLGLVVVWWTLKQNTPPPPPSTQGKINGLCIGTVEIILSPRLPLTHLCPVGSPPHCVVTLGPELHSPRVWIWTMIQANCL